MLRDNGDYYDNNHDGVFIPADIIPKLSEIARDSLDNCYSYEAENELIGRKPPTEFKLKGEKTSRITYQCYCKICNNENLLVARGEHATYVKCANCKYEIRVHWG